MPWTLWGFGRDSLCSANPREKEFVDSELTRGRVSKLLLEVAIDLWLNLIVKTSILYSGFVLP